MKKTSFIFYLVLLCLPAFSQTKVEVIDYIGNEVQFIINRSQESNSFKSYYAFQYNSSNVTSVLAGHRNFILERVSADGIAITSENGTTIRFSISQESEADVSGYGFSSRHGAYTLVTEGEPHIWNILTSTSQKPKPKDFDCDSGGEGSSECSTSGGVASVETGCSVGCKAGYYACCDQAKSECKCFNIVTGEPYEGEYSSVTAYTSQ